MTKTWSQWSSVYLVVLGALLLGGCPAKEAANSNPLAGDTCIAGTQRVCQCPTGSVSNQTCVPAGGSYGECQCGGASTDTAALPCEVSKVLTDKCLSCHGEPLQFTAPMHLRNHGDFTAPSHSNPAVSVQAQVKARIHSTQSPMPPSTLPQLTAAELATLDAWLDGGAPASTGAGCEINHNGGAGTTGSQAGTGGLDDDDNKLTDAGASEDIECFDFFAHASGGDTPYAVPNGTKDLYYCWTFAPPFDGEVQGISFKSKIDNSDIIHHWLLYQNSTAQSAGQSPCSGSHPDAALVAGWAVGGSNTIMPDDVGMQMGNKGYTLEIHYNNATGKDLMDASGTQVCVTKKPRPHVAAVHWLGTTSLFMAGAGDINSTCTPNYSNGPINILSSWPHMHKHGTWLKSTIVHSDGTEEELIDKKFDFNYQIAYPTPMVINSGDKIKTTCTYGSGPVQFGEGTDQEMCFNFVVAWPAGSLTSASIGSFTQNQCFN